MGTSTKVYNDRFKKKYMGVFLDVLIGPRLKASAVLGKAGFCCVFGEILVTITHEKSAIGRNDLQMDFIRLYGRRSAMETVYKSIKRL